MANKLLLLIFCVTVFNFSALAQLKTVAGHVKDAETNEPIAHCAVFLLQTGIKTSTDSLGKFTLQIPENTVKPYIKCQALGFLADSMSVEKKTVVHLFLRHKENILNEIVITGVSGATKTKENPISIVLIGAKAIEKSVESNIIDALVKNAPGLTAMKTGPNISKPFIRGLGYNRVLTLYDGIRQEGQQWGDEHGIEVDAYNIEKAEVIKGPASLMFGSDALAGVVSLFPYIPTNTNGKVKGKFYSEYQSNNGLFGEGLRINYGNASWTFVGRGSYRIAKNYQNAIDGRVYNTNFRELNASATAIRKFKNGSTHLSATLYDNLQGIPDGSRDSLTRKFTKQTAEGEEDDIKNRTLVADNELNSYKLSPLHQHIQHYRVYTKNHYTVGKGELDFILGLQQNNRREYNHPSAPKQAGMFVSLQTINYSLGYSRSMFKNLDLSLGLNGMYQRNENKDATDFPIPNYNLFDKGSYVFLKYKLNRFTLSGGARLDFRTLRGNDLFVFTDSATGFTKHRLTAQDANDYRQFSKFEKHFNGLSYSLGATYAITEKLSVKSNIGRGYRAPSVTELASNGLDPGAHIVYLGNLSFKPEFSTQEDLGIIADWKQVKLNASVFHNFIQNYIYLSQLQDQNGNSVVDNQGNKTYQYQQSKAQLYGYELFVDYKPTFIQGVNFTNSITTVYGFNKNNQWKAKGINGEYLPFIPPFKWNSAVSKLINSNSVFFANFNFRLELEYNAVQNRYLALNNTETATPSFTLYNFTFSTELRNKNNPSIQFQINNLLNTSYQSNLSRLKYFENYASSPTGKTGIYGMGRNIGIKVVWPF